MATQTRAPTSDEAVTGTWSGSVGSRWTLVDDYPSVATNDLLTGGTTTAVITFGFSAFTVPAGSTSISIQVMYFDGEAANGANNCGGRIKVGGTYYNAATHNPAGTAGTTRTDDWATNPKTGAAWTVDDVNGVGANALQAFGMNSTDSNPTWRFSSIQAQVTYTAPSSSGTGATSSSAQATSGAGTVRTSGTGATGGGAQVTAASGTVIVLADAASASAAQVGSGIGEVVEEETDVIGSGSTGSSVQVSAGAGTARVAGAGTTLSGACVAAGSGTVVCVASGATASAVRSNAASGTVVVGGGVVTLASSQACSGYDAAPVYVAQHDHGWCVTDRNRRARMGGRRR